MWIDWRFCSKQRDLQRKPPGAEFLRVRRQRARKCGWKSWSHTLTLSGSCHVTTPESLYTVRWHACGRKRRCDWGFEGKPSLNIHAHRRRMGQRPRWPDNDLIWLRKIPTRPARSEIEKPVVDQYSSAILSPQLATIYSGTDDSEA